MLLFKRISRVPHLYLKDHLSVISREKVNAKYAKNTIGQTMLMVIRILYNLDHVTSCYWLRENEQLELLLPRAVEEDNSSAVTR
jgi:hypothetical protein